MEDIGQLKLNALNHNREKQMVEFSFKGSQGNQITSLSGSVPLTMPADPNARQMAKDAIRQLLAEALEALD